ncbi:MAG TPA: FecR domain-containing protein [Verrucomicrobiae bacterium]|jgi:hypothetical protein|nr:FecR domain-containing protein [Verrucomicrobiae bacterium]
MTKTNSFTHKLLAGAVALAMVALAACANAENVPQYATVVRLDGQARYSTDNNKTWSPLKLGDVLKPGSVIQTAEKSSVDIVMGDAQEGATIGTSRPSPISTGGAGSGDSGPKANIVRIDASSVLAVDKMTLDKTGMDEVSETQLDLRAGKIFGNVKKLSAASRYEVKLPNGVAGIRGTSYILNSDGSVWVLTGQVIITYVSPTGAVMTQTVSAGQSFTPPSVAGGTGTVQTIPPTELANLIAGEPGVPAPTGGPTISYTPNGTLIHISPD